MNTPWRAFVVLLVGLAALVTSCGSDSEGAVETGDDSGSDVLPPGAGPYPVARLTIDYTDGSDSTSYVIVCLGDTAELIGDVHGVDAATACLAMAEPDVQERLIDGVPPDRMCSAQYGGPDEAAIAGLLDGQHVDTAVNRRDGCGISEWETLLADLLPPAGNNL